MTTFNTGNAVPSSDAKDLSDNAENFDSAVNTQADTWQDRLAVTRDTVNGRIKKMGYAVPIVYAGGELFTVNDNVKTVIEGGFIYAPLQSALPFTTDGTFANDAAKFFVVQGLTNDQIINDLSQTYNFATVADYKAFATEFPDGKRIFLEDRNAYFTKATGTGSATGYGSIDSTAANQNITIVVIGIAYTEQFGMASTATDAFNTGAIQEALDYGVGTIDFGSTLNTFDYTTLLIRASTTVYFNSVTLRTSITTGVAISTESLARTNMRLIGQRANFTAAVATDDVDLIQIGGNVFVEVHGLVLFNTAGHSIIIGGLGTRDPTSFVISNCETSTGRGLKILAGEVDGIEYNSVTTGTIRDCFWTIFGQDEPSINMIANDFTAGGASSIFGITISRCSLNSVFEDFGKMVKMKASGVSNISLIRFENCEGETRGESLTNFLVDIEQVDRSYFNIRTRSSDYNAYRLINSSENIITTDRDSSSNSTLLGLTMIDFDVNSGNNIVDNVVGTTDQLDTEITSNAPYAPLYYSKYKDANGSNTFSGGLTTNLTRVVKTDALGVYSPAGELINPDYDNPPKAANVWTDNGDGTYTVVCSTTPQSGFNLNVPDAIAINDDMVVRLEYKFADITGLVDGWKFESSSDGTSRAVTIPLTTDFVDVVYITKMTGRQLRVYHVGAIVPATVTFIVRKFEVFKGRQLPYPFNYQPVDILTQFDKFPHTTTGKLPVTLGIGTQIFDSAVNVLKVWNGASWV